MDALGNRDMPMHGENSLLVLFLSPALQHAESAR